MLVFRRYFTGGLYPHRWTKDTTGARGTTLEKTMQTGVMSLKMPANGLAGTCGILFAATETLLGPCTCLLVIDESMPCGEGGRLTNS